MNKIIPLKLAAAVLLAGICLPGAGKSKKVVLEPLPMLYADSTRTVLPFAKDPTVIRLGDRYLMYYSVKGFDKNLIPAGRPKEALGWHSGIAESRDLVHWKRVGELDLRDVDGNQLWGAVAPCVKVFDGVIHMFYQHRWAPASNNSNLWHAVSEDGITFRNTSAEPLIVPETGWSLNRSIDAEVYWVKDKMMLMFATRDKENKIQMLGMASAPYGCDYARDKWTMITVDKPFMKPDYDWEMHCIEAPTVIKEGKYWYLFYAGAYNHELQQIGLCTSKDGVHFKRIAPDGLLFHNGAKGTWNHGESGHPGVFRDDDGQVYLFFQGKASRKANYFLSVCKVHFQ